MGLEQSVKEYYDRNTKRFLKYGQGGKTDSIHRAVFSPDVKDRKAAFRYHENKILDLIKKINPEIVVDLGCGTGSSIAFLSSMFSTRYHGITISSVQADLAGYLNANPLLSIVAGSYLDKYSYQSIEKITGRKFLYAIESYLHCPDRNSFFNIMKTQTNPGDVLVICDDFKILNKNTIKRNRKDIADFTAGWHAAELQSIKDLKDLSFKYGFDLKEDTELTPWLSIDRPRDLLISFLVPLLRVFKIKNSWWQNLLGGNALRKGLKKGWLSYRFLVFERIDT